MAEGGGSTGSWPTFLQRASLLQEKLQDATAGTHPALAHILELAAQEFGIERDDRAESRQPRRKRSKRERNELQRNEEKQPSHLRTLVP